MNMKTTWWKSKEGCVLIYVTKKGPYCLSKHQKWRTKALKNLWDWGIYSRQRKNKRKKLFYAKGKRGKNRLDKNRKACPWIAGNLWSKISLRTLNRTKTIILFLRKLFFSIISKNKKKKKGKFIVRKASVIFT